SYNATEPWNNALAHSAIHNTLTVDGRDQMRPISKFLWLPWAVGRVTENKQSVEGHLAYWQGEHDGYAPVRHRRAILRLGEETWLVFDHVQGGTARKYRLHWLLAHSPHVWNQENGTLKLELPPGEYYVRIHTVPAGIQSLVCADP